MGVNLELIWTRILPTLIVAQLCFRVGVQVPYMDIKFSEHASHSFIPMTRYMESFQLVIYIGHLI